eukprot:scaffold19263_cov131-Skeletonema_marinoi.AAC.3
MMNSDLSARLKLKSLLLVVVDQFPSEPPQKNDRGNKPLEEISSTKQPAKSHEASAPSLAEQMMTTAA